VFRACALAGHDASGSGPLLLPTADNTADTDRELIGYAVEPEGSLDEITSATIPYYSPMGLGGF
jgi:hypothetical protein